MALIERIRMRPRTLFKNTPAAEPRVLDPQILDQDLDPKASSLFLSSSELWTLPGLRIQARSTTASFSDYATFDLRQIAGAEFNAMITDGSSS